MKRLILLAALAAFVVTPASIAQDHGGMNHGGMDHGTMDHGDSTRTHAGHHMPMRANDAARPSPNAGVMQTIGTTTVMIHYGRPSVKGRDIFGGLVPYGEVWRTGANEATVVMTSGDLTVGGETLPAGTYSLHTIPGQTEWTVIFNSVAEQWGSFNYDEAQDALRVTAPPVTADAPQEQFQISFESVSATGAVMVLAWDDVRVPVSLSVGG